MKKLLCALCALMWTLAAFPAGAAGVPTLYRLMAQAEDGTQICVATAVALSDGAALTTAEAALRAGDVTIAADGEERTALRLAPSETAGLAVLTLAQPVTADAEPGALTGELRYWGALSDGRLVSGAATAMQPASWKGQYALLLTAQAGLCPGAVLLDAHNGVAAMVVAGYGEGVGRYVALPLAGGEMRQSAWLTDVALSSQNGQLTVDWSGSAADFDEDSAVAVYIANEDNPYYAYASLPAAEGGMTFPLIPGQAHDVWVLHHHGEASSAGLTADAPAIRLDAEAPRSFNKYGYRDEALYLAAVPASAKPGDTEALPAAERVTAAQLADPDEAFYLQARSKYRTKKEQEALLVWTLTTPEGCVLWGDGSFAFLTELEGTDDWHVNLTELFRDYGNAVPGAPAAGRYVVAYYLDGAKAGEFAFTAE